MSTKPACGPTTQPWTDSSRRRKLHSTRDTRSIFSNRRVSQVLSQLLCDSLFVYVSNSYVCFFDTYKGREGKILLPYYRNCDREVNYMINKPNVCHKRVVTEVVTGRGDMIPCHPTTTFPAPGMRSPLACCCGAGTRSMGFPLAFFSFSGGFLCLATRGNR